MQIVSDVDLTACNTFGLRSRARFAATVASDADLAELAAFSSAQGLRLKAIGGGSNLLLREDIDCAVALIASKGISVVAEDERYMLVRARAGENWHGLVEWTVRQGIGGLENLAGIPGTVGAAPVQNIGAYGLELMDRVVSLTAFDLAVGGWLTFWRRDCGFGYRNSIFKDTDRFIISGVTLALPRPWRPTTGYRGLESLGTDADPSTVMERVLELRRTKLPDWRILGNAGSFFQNPVVPLSLANRVPEAPRFAHGPGTVKLSAAWMIEACGLKDAREGQAGVHQSHALILVNHGGATFSEVTRLAERVRNAVLARFGVLLVQEPVIL